MKSEEKIRRSEELKSRLKIHRSEELKSRWLKSYSNSNQIDREKAGLESTLGTWEELQQMDHVVHLSPLSEVANEVWMFWETGRMLIRFASDIDLENSAVWDHDELAVQEFA